MTRVLSTGEARAFYDRISDLYELTAVFEDAATDLLLARSRFEEASSVVELGCGTGRLAERLLRERLAPGARYLGVDVSAAMILRTRARLRPFGARAEARRSEGAPAIDLPDGACDRFVSTYVLDLLDEEAIRAVLVEARRLLAPGGLLCLTSMTTGDSMASRLVCRAWSRLHALRPALVGGCRPIRLVEFLDGTSFRVERHERVERLGFCTEVLVAA